MPEGDRRSRFEALYEDLYEPVLAYALRRVGEDLVDDVVAETFLVAWRRLELIPPDPLPWLLATARRAIANQVRSGRRNRHLGERLRSEIAGARETFADPGEQVSDHEQMVGALERLTDEDREVLMLVSWEGLSNERAAGVLRISPEAFGVRLHRARRRLANELANLEGRAPEPQDGGNE